MNVQKTMDDIKAWTDVQFPEQSVLGKLSHLKEEITELQNAVDNGIKADIDDELADCWILLLNATSYLNYNEKDIKSIIDNKLAINKARKWGKPTREGIVHHIH